MVEKTLLDALTTYKIHLQIGNNVSNKTEIERIVKHIELCEKYLENGNKISDKWMKDNCTILSKAIKCAYDSLQHNKAEQFDNSTKEECIILNKFTIYYTQLYKELGFDFGDIHY